MAATGGYDGARVHDIKLADPDPAVAAAMQARIEEAGLIACATPTEAVTDAGIILCVVTADQAVKAAALAAHPSVAPEDARYRAVLAQWAETKLNG